MNAFPPAEHHKEEKEQGRSRKETTALPRSVFPGCRTWKSARQRACFWGGPASKK